MSSAPNNQSLRPGYIVNIILIIFLALPLLLSLVFVPLLMSNAFHTSGGYGLGQLSLMFVIPLVVGGVAGMAFCTGSRSKPSSPWARYLPVAAPLIIFIGIAVYAYAVSNGNYNSPAWGVFAWANPAYLIVNLLLSLSGYGGLMPVHVLSAAAGFVLGFVLWDFRRRQFSGTAGMRWAAGCLVAAVAGSWLFMGIANKEQIQDGIAKLRYGETGMKTDLAEYDLSQMAPFKKNNGLATLGSKPQLSLTDLNEMPRLDGATALYPVYAAFAETVYEGLAEWDKHKPATESRNNLYVSVDEFPYSIVKCSTTPNAYENLMNKIADIIIVAEPSQSQLEQVRAREDEFVMTPLGSDAFVFFANKKNPAENLTINQIRDIYTGKITNWKEVGGKSVDILPYQRPQDSGSQTAMQNKVMKGLEMMEPTTVTRAGGMGEVISKVASYRNSKNALGYTFMYYASSMVKDNRIKYLAVDGIKPSPETIRDGTYPFAGQFYAVTLKSNTSPQVRKLLDWMTSAEGQTLVEKTGYVPATAPAPKK
ncbi:substrate-binding domain-containing protein [Paenibacillus sp. YN15]|uniref:substrate-binding domain-containing protein n=1 Tax=Paenibacillus sp. YN15 TaxID=1742774 RepID=UPI0015EB4168|nr:substrate-binding domain-containing protein [Paenibacillus sp. YN15]